MMRLAEFVLCIIVVLGIGVSHFSHPLKDTQRCQLFRVTGQSFWFVRPDGEVFEMFFDNPPAALSPGMNFTHVLYKDDNAYMRHFVSAQLAGYR